MNNGINESLIKESTINERDMNVSNGTIIEHNAPRRLMNANSRKELLPPPPVSNIPSHMLPPSSTPSPIPSPIPVNNAITPLMDQARSRFFMNNKPNVNMNATPNPNHCMNS